MKKILLLLAGTLTFGTAVFAQPGALDTSFAPGLGANNAITAIARQADGKIVIGGNFVNYNGNALAKRFGRVNANGSLDTTFNPGTNVGLAGSGLIGSIEIQADGKIVMGGNFTVYNAVSRMRIARVNTDASLDLSFDPLGGISGQVADMLIQPDGKYLVSGIISAYNNNYSVGNDIIRIDPSTGQLDNTFANMTGTNAQVKVIALQADGKILIGGDFTSYNGVPVGRIARLNADGTLDNTFSGSASATVNAITLQTDGKILVGGDFYTFNGTVVNRITRLNSDGTLDNTFSSGSGANMVVHAIALQPNGKILIGGQFNTYNGDQIGHLTRLNTDGSRDLTFNPGNPGCDNTLTNIIVEPGAQTAIIAGHFENYNSISRNRIARVFLETVCVNTYGTDSITACGSYTWTNGVTYTSSNNTATDTLVGGSFSGCDSIITLNLTLHPFPVLSPLSGINSCAAIGLDTLTISDAANTGATFSWFTDAACTVPLSSPSNVTSSGTYYTVGTANGCSDTTSISVTIQPALNPAVFVSTNTQLACEGNTVTYTAMVLNPGTAPTYIWYKNGIPVGTDSIAYADNTILATDEVYVQLIPVESCVVSDTVESIHIIIDVAPVLVPSVSITATPGNVITAGQQVTFTASPVNGGSNPQYTWLKNGSPIPGAPNTASYSTSSLQNNDVISCVLQSDTLCATPDTALSNGITITISTTGLVTNIDASVSVYPNPATDMVQVALEGTFSYNEAQIRLIDVSGRTLLLRRENISAGKQVFSLDTAQLPAGLYHLQIRAGGSLIAAQKVMIMR
ncbi:MAG: T9SS type A sorting domain-containing protein [Bacteroidia bacterium]|nr:T9SS type A sorting domain-containing protein [Bacteroidia bacterium]